MFSRRRVLGGLASAAALPVLPGCQSAPATGDSNLNFYSTAEERALGRREHPKVVQSFGGLFDDTAVQSYINAVGNRLLKFTETPGEVFRFVVLDTNIVNALALPGHVHVTRGLLGLIASEAELAAVIGHELGHIMGRHIGSRISQEKTANTVGEFFGFMTTLVGVPFLGNVMPLLASYPVQGALAFVRGYSREQEYEADSLAVRYSSRAGYNPQAAVDMLSRLDAHNRLEAQIAGRPPGEVDEFHFTATHPRTVDRVEAALAATLKAPPTGEYNRDQYLAAIDGLPYDGDMNNGFMHEGKFYSPEAGFSFRPPPAFRMAGGPGMLTHPSGTAILLASERRSVGDIANTLQSRYKTKLASLEKLNVAGIDGVTGVTSGTYRNRPVEIRFAVLSLGQGRAARLAIPIPRDAVAKLDPPLREALDTFRLLKPEEAETLRPHTLRVYTVAEGDTVESIATRMPLDGWHIERFRLLNALTPNQVLVPGQRVRVVAA